MKESPRKECGACKEKENRRQREDPVGAAFFRRGIESTKGGHLSEGKRGLVISGL
jgi:hypothetical protein